MAEKKFETKAIRLQEERSRQREHAVPVYLTSSFVFEDAEQMRAIFADEQEGYIYSRFSNPNASEFEMKMAALEGAEDGFATASGMAAVFASFMAFLSSGDHILASRGIFGSTHQILEKLLPKWGITHTLLDTNDIDNWEQHIKPNSKILFIETPSNPGLDIIDMEKAGKLAEKHNLILNVDNCFATPYLQQPIKYGAHIVTHSATKYIDGQGRVTGGIAVGDKKLIEEIRQFCRKTGPAISPFNAWILSKSLETLAVRMDRHSENAFKLAQKLENNPEVENVKYPFLPSHPGYEVAKKQMKTGGGLVAFTVKGGLERGRNFLDALQMASLTANLGDTRTIATHPASTTHAKLTEEERLAAGITPGMIRISVGLEHIDDIVEDIEQALVNS